MRASQCRFQEYIGILIISRVRFAIINNTKEPDRSTKTSPANCAILIIDDSESDRYTYRRYLEAADRVGCQI